MLLGMLCLLASMSKCSERKHRVAATAEQERSNLAMAHLIYTSRRPETVPNKTFLPFAEKHAMRYRLSCSRQQVLSCPDILVCKRNAVVRGRWSSLPATETEGV